MKVPIAIVSCAAVIAVSIVIPNPLPLSSRLVPSVGQTIAADADQLGILEKSLETSNLSEFRKTAEKVLPAGCATIYSRWYCDKLSASETNEDKDRAKHEVRLRNLGKHLLQKFEVECAKLTRPDVGLEECRTTARELLALSHWLLKGDGYGNGVLASRCRVIAGVAVAHLVVEESIPVEEAKSLTEALDSLGDVKWIQWAVRAHEHEFPGCLAPYVENEETPEGVRKALLMACIRGQSLLAESGIKVGVGKVGVDLEPTRQARLSLPSNLAIYLNDPAFGSSTLEQWDRFCLLPDPLHTRLVADLRATVLFRQCIGGFPLAPLPEGALKDGKLSDRYLSRTHAAFDKAWYDFSHKKEFMNSDLRKDPITGRMVVDPEAENLSTKYSNMGLGGNAALIYDAAKSGRFDNYLQGDVPKK